MAIRLRMSGLSATPVRQSRSCGAIPNAITEPLNLYRCKQAALDQAALAQVPYATTCVSLLHRSTQPMSLWPQHNFCEHSLDLVMVLLLG